MKNIQIGNFYIGEGLPVFIIAEIGVNHNGHLKLALALIDEAKKGGADAVKFQKRNLEKLYPEKVLANPNKSEKSLRYLIPILKQTELSEEAFETIANYCKKIGILFFASAFDGDSADFLETLDVPAYKVASADLTNIPLLDHLVTKRKPLILSTGMSTMKEVNHTVDFLQSRGVEFALLHCNSTYPAPFEDINLKLLGQLKQFGVPVGYSGHERGIAVSVAAVAMGAAIIERHITFDRNMEGPDHRASLEPMEFMRMVSEIRIVETAMGDGREKRVSVGEIANRDVLGKSLVAATVIKKGERITKGKIAVKGPGFGLSLQRFSELIGKTSTRTIDKDELFTERDISGNRSDRLEHAFPLEWGLVARFRDFSQILKHKPRCIEFHLTDKDLDETPPKGRYAQKLIVHAPEFFENNLVNICTDDRSHRDASLSIIQRSIDIGRTMASSFLGKPKIIVHPGAMSLQNTAQKPSYYEKNLLRSLTKLDYSGVEFLLENLPPRPWYFGGQWHTHYFMDAQELLAFCRKTHLGICYDVSHGKLYCNFSHKPLLEQIQQVFAHIRHLHVSDASGIDGEGLQIGMGTIDFADVLRLFSQGYAGTVVPEIWRGHMDGGLGFLTAIDTLSAIYKGISTHRA